MVGRRLGPWLLSLGGFIPLWQNHFPKPVWFVPCSHHGTSEACADLAITKLKSSGNTGTISHRRLFWLMSLYGEEQCRNSVCWA
jgi:hypothetical protein